MGKIITQVLFFSLLLVPVEVGVPWLCCWQISARLELMLGYLQIPAALWQAVSV